MTRPFSTRIVAIVLLWLSCTPCMAEKLTLERLFAAPDLSGPTLRSARFSPDGKRVAYLRGKQENKDRLDLWAYDVASGKHALLVDSAVLDPQQQALSAEEAQRRERQRTASLGGIVEYEFSPDSRQILVPLGGDLYLYDLRAPAGKAVRRLTQTETYETDAHFSPHGRYVSFIRDQNLLILEISSGRETAITRDGGGLVSFGQAEFVAQEEMGRSTGYWWSPDEKRIAYAHVDETPVAEVERFEIYADSVKVVKQRYPTAGARNADVSLFIANVPGPGSNARASATSNARDGAGAAATRVDLGADPDFYLVRVDWLPDGSALVAQKQSRDQKTLSLLKADALSGATHELLAEQSESWIDIHDELTFLKHSPQFIWASSRSGHKHLYLYDLDGRLLHPITQGEWEVVAEGDKRAIKGVDERRRVLYFMSNANTPIERHLYVTSLDAQGTPQQITAAAGWHDVAMADDAQQFLDTFSTPERPPSVTLRSASGSVRATVLANEVTPDHPYARYLPDHVPKEFGTLQASDGQTLHFQILKPQVIEAGKRYPVILDVYGGPGVQLVRRSWIAQELFYQYLVQHGYIVFTLDNRGSASRGVKFESAIYHRMSSAEVEDQITGVRWLKSLPYVDPKRIGVFGWSYGGYMTLMCLLKAPDQFAVGVSGAPVTDWRLYDTHYTERYMGTAAENPDGYAAGNVMNQAEALRAPLLIMHGMADDNVLFTHSTALFKKLQDLNKPFDVMPYPGSKHGLLRNAETGPHAYATVVRFLDEHLKPSAP